MCLLQLQPGSDFIAQPATYLSMVVQKRLKGLEKSSETSFSQAWTGDVSQRSITRLPDFHLFSFGSSVATASLPGRPWSLPRCMLSAAKSNPILSTCSNIRSRSSSTTICFCVISLALLAIRFRRKGSIPPATVRQQLVSSIGWKVCMKEAPEVWIKLVFNYKYRRISFPAHKALERKYFVCS